MYTTYIIGFILLVLILSGLFIVKQQTSAIVERFGKFQSIRSAGLHLPAISTILVAFTRANET